MTRLSDVIQPKSKKRTIQSLDQYLWSYRPLDFLILVLKRNRGYISRKIFNFIYELMEVSFLAFFCHPDFYAALLIIPFSSFFMNLMNEELFSLNRSAVFDAKPISMRFNYSLIIIVFIVFIAVTGFLVQDIIRHHWILSTLFVARMALIAVQSFSFAYSLEIITKKRVFFSPLNWWVGLAFSIVALVSLGLALSVEKAVASGIMAIYGSRIFIECRFIYSIKELRKKRKFFRTSLFEIKNTLIRFVSFLLTLSTLYFLSEMLSKQDSDYINLAVFFVLILLLRTMNRPFRALQIDFFNYLTFKRKEWVYFRQVQILKFNLLIFTPFLFWFLFSTHHWILFVPLFLLLWNLNALLAMSSVGQEVSLGRIHIPLRVLAIGLYLIAHTWVSLMTFYLSEILISIYFFKVFKLEKKLIPLYLENIQLNLNPKYSSLDYIKEIRNHDGPFLVLNFNNETRNHLKKLFARSLPFQPVLLSQQKWIIPQASHEIHEVWKMFPRELRKIDVISKNEILKNCLILLKRKLPDPNVSHLFLKIDKYWCLNGVKILDPELIKFFAEIETQSSAALSLDKCKFSYYLKGQYYYPLIKLGEVETIFMTTSYSQKVVDNVEEKFWLFLKSYFCPSF
jgi:hypothetical protein